MKSRKKKGISPRFNSQKLRLISAKAPEKIFFRAGKRNAGTGIKFDCRYFDGSKPCRFKAVCGDCGFYKPMNKRIMIIKLASVGDVLRTSVILPALKAKYPQSYITWLVRDPAQEILEGNPYIDRVMVYNLESVLGLNVERFDMLISLDKAQEAVSLASLIKATEKYGYGMDEKGKIFPFNKEAGYYFLLGLDDELKFRENKKSYQEMIFQICGLEYARNQYELALNGKEIGFAEEFFKKNNLKKNEKVIGVNTGAGKVFANKHLKPERIIELVDLLAERVDARIILLGGPLEREANRHIAGKLGSKVINSNCDHSLRNFSSLINRCSLLITADTLALHIAIALKRPVIALFGPTCHQEIELYGRGRKIVTDMECAPCYKGQCDRGYTCMDRVSLEEIVEAAGNLFSGKNRLEK